LRCPPRLAFSDIHSDIERVNALLRQVDPLIRQLTLYRDLIDKKTGDQA